MSPPQDHLLLLLQRRPLLSSLPFSLRTLLLFLPIMMAFDSHRTTSTAISNGETLLNSSIFGISPISPVTMWSASGHIITLIGYNCTFPTSITVAQLLSNLVEIPTPFSAPYGWDYTKARLITTSSVSVVTASPLVIARIPLQPVAGFVLASALSVKWAGTVGTCGATISQPLTFSANANGGFDTVLFLTNFPTTNASVINEYDIQNKSLTLVVALQYNVFILTSPTVLVSDTSTTTTALSTGWTFSRFDNYTLIGTHASVPSFNIPAGQTVTFSVAIPAAQTFLNKAPSPSTTSFTINAVDGNPVAYCVLSNNLTDKLIRIGQGFVDITLTPSTNDYFNLYPDLVSEQTTWNGTISSALLPAGVSVTYNVLSSTAVRLTFSSASNFFMTDAVSVVFSPRPSALRSMTAGCGVLRLPISPAPVDVAVVLAGSPSSINITELDIQFRVTNLTASIPVDSKMFRTTILPPCTTEFRNSPICFDVSAVDSSPLGLIETRFLAALAATNASIVASAPTEFTLSIAIPPLPTYNIDHDKIECITVRIPAGAMKSGVAPNTTTIPSFCIRGVNTTAAVTFRSSGSNVTDAAGLWDNGDVMMVSLVGGVWNTSAVWSEGRPLLNSSNGDFSAAALTFSPILFSNISFSSDHRIVYLPIVPCVGLSVLANETGSLTLFRSLAADSSGLTTNRVTFHILQANSSVVGFSCANICTMDDSATATIFITEANVRAGFSFTVTSIYDDLVDQDTLTRQRWSLFTRNVPALVSYPGVSLTVVRTNNYTATFSFGSMPDFDITADAVAVIFLNTSFLRNKGVRSALRGFLLFKATVPQPVCSLASFSPAVSERAIQNGDVSFFFTSTLPFHPLACANLASGLWTLVYTDTPSLLPLNITVGNCTRDFNATGGLLPMIIHQNASYDIS
ncbi:Hypothetical protein, putative, partial [Bodo saltans]